MGIMNILSSPCPKTNEPLTPSPGAIYFDFKNVLNY